MIRKLFNYMLVISICLIPLQVLSFDIDKGKFKEFENLEPNHVAILSDGWVTVLTIGQAEGLYPDDEKGQRIYRRGVGVFSMVGTGYYVDKGFIITAAHLIKPEKIEINRSPNSNWVVPIDRIINVMYYVGKYPAILIWIDRERDLAILKVNIKHCPGLKDYGYKTTWTFDFTGDKLHEGDAIALITFARDRDGSMFWYHQLKFGKIVDPIELRACLPGHFFLLEVEVVPGDSGAPVFAFQEGKPVIVGIIQAYLIYKGKLYALAGRIDIIHRILLEKE